MFDNPSFPHPLEDSVFESWMEYGRSSKIGYSFLLILWDELERKYLPVYAEDRNQFIEMESFGNLSLHESLIAVYDLYSGSKII